MNDIAFTFGIITDAENGVNDNLKNAIKSIIKLKIPQYEIIIVGNKKNLENDNLINGNDKINCINFDENIRPMWITKKKNLITQFSNYDYIVYQHDYYRFNENWYVGFQKYITENGPDIKACMTKVVNQDGSRFRDWTLFPWHHCTNGKLANETKKLWDYSGIVNNECCLPYDEHRFNKYQYFTGGYWVATKKIMEEIPLNEKLLWAEGEDLEWSERYINKYKFQMNPYSTMNLLKQKQEALYPFKEECLKKAIQYIENTKL